MKSKLKKIFGVSISAVALLAGVIVSTVFMSSPAQGKSNSLISKAIGYGVYDCYQNGGMLSEISMQQYDGIDSITSIGHLVNLPYGYYGDLTNTTCAKLISGAPDGGYAGAVALKGVTIPSDNKNTAAVIEFMTNMGYTEKKGNQEGLCANFPYTGSKDNSTYITTMCITTDKNRVITGDRFQIYDKNGNSSVPYSSTIVQFEAQNGAVSLDCSSVIGHGGCDKHTFVPGETKFDTFAGEILGDLQEHRASVPYGVPNAFGVRPYVWRLGEMSIEPFGDVTSTFSLDNTAAAGKKAVEFLTGYGSISDLKLSDSEKLELLKDYLTDWYKVDNYGCNLDSSARNIATGAGYKPIRSNIFSGNEYQTCYIKPTAHVGLSVASYGSSSYFDGHMMGFGEIIESIEGLTNSFIEADKQKCNEAATSARQAAQNLLDQSTTSEEYRQRAQNTISSIDQIKDSYGEYWYDSGGNIGCYKFVGLDGQIVDTEITPPSQDNDFEPPVEGANDLASCFSNASSLGWILCPTTLLVGQATGGIYESIENDFLFFDPGMLDREEQPGVYDAWKIIRDFANIIFAIALVIVILSQVTGIGVSNYGIKKILPSLIIVAILVNLSFFGCQLLVDISNIFGSGLKDLFESFKVVSENDVSLSQIGTGIASTLATGGLLFGAGAVAASTWELWILPLFLSVLVAFISLMFFYILLAVRQALLLILIIIAPLAIVCYALPNTKKMFDRWWRIFWALLVLYPICGALIGGTKFASSLFLSMKQDSFFFNLVAVLLQVVPVFFIPTLLKGSLNALGSLGMRISNFGRNLSQRAGRTISGSEGFKDINRRLGMNNSLRRYNQIKEGHGAANALSRSLSRFGFTRTSGALDAYNQRRSAKYMDNYRKGRIEDIKAEVGSYPMSAREESALRDQIQMGQLDDLAKAYESDYRTSGMADNEQEMIKEHARALETVRANPDDREARARLMGIQNILSTSDGGRSGMQNNLYQVAAAMQDSNQTADAGLRFATSQMLRSDGALYKAKNKGFHSFLVDAANNSIKFNQGTFATDNDKTVLSSYYDGDKIGSWSGAALAGADEGALDRLLSSAGKLNRNSNLYAQMDQNGRAALDQDRKNLDINTFDALTNPNIELQPKIRAKLNRIRTAAGLAVVTNPGQANVNIPHNKKRRRGRKK